MHVNVHSAGSRGVVTGWERTSSAQVEMEDKVRNATKSLFAERKTMMCPRIKFDCGLTKVLLPYDFFVG